MLATDTPLETTEKQPLPRALETWAENEPMRHVPALEWLIRKVDVDMRGKLAKLTPAVASLPAEDARRVAIENAMRGVCRALDRVSEAARHDRSNGAPSEVSNRLQWSLDRAVAKLKSVEVSTFGRRYPFHLFERSPGEQVYGAVLTLIQSVEQLVPLIREADPGLDERLLEGLVVLQNPLDSRMLQPIA